MKCSFENGICYNSLIRGPIIQGWQHWFWCNTYLIFIKAQLNQFSHGTALCKWKKMFLCPLVVDKCTNLKASSWHVVPLLWGGREKQGGFSRVLSRLHLSSLRKKREISWHRSNTFSTSSFIRRCFSWGLA